MTEPKRLAHLQTELRLLKADVASLSHRLDVLIANHQSLVGTASGHEPTPADDELDPSTVITGLRPARAQISGDWEQMPPALAASAWQALTAWVDQLIDRYELHEHIPACWYRHGPLVEELHALHLAWYGAYGAPDATPTAPADWHNYLQAALTRTRNWDTRGCTSGEHRAAIPPPADPQARADRQRFIDEDLEARARLEQTRAAAHPA